MSSEDQILVGKAVTSGKVHIGIVVVDVELFKKENQKTIFDVRRKADAKDDIIRLISKKSDQCKQTPDLLSDPAHLSYPHIPDPSNGRQKTHQRTSQRHHTTSLRIHTLPLRPAITTPATNTGTESTTQDLYVC